MIKIVNLVFEYMTRENLQLSGDEAFVLIDVAVKVAKDIYNIDKDAATVFNDILDNRNYFERCYLFMGLIESWLYNNAEEPDMITDIKNRNIMKSIVKAIYEEEPKS